MERSDMKVRIYQCPDRRVPYLEWLQGFRDKLARYKIQARIARVRLGNFGQARSVGEGVHDELKVDYGSGYRIYFGRDGEQLVILLRGGDKRTQDADIKEAQAYWASYKREKKDAND